MKFKVGDIVKVVGYSPSIERDTTEHRFIGKKAEIEAIHKLRDGWKKLGYIYYACNGNLFREDQLKEIPIYKTEIYKALTEGE